MLPRLQDALWLLEVPLFASIAFFMWRNGYYRRMPLFFSYNVFQAVGSGAAYLIYHWNAINPHADAKAIYSIYFYTFWSVTTLSHILEFAIIYELFGALFRQREGLKDFGTMLFRWAIVVMLLMGLILTASSNGLRIPEFLKMVMSAERSIQLMMVGLVLFLLAFSTHLGITRRHKVFGIIVGFGFLSAVELLLFTVQTRIGDSVFNYVHLIAFTAMQVIWLAYAAMKEPVEVLPNMLLRSQRWNEALLPTQEVPDAAPTLLLGIENLVERAMANAGAERDPHSR